MRVTHQGHEKAGKVFIIGNGTSRQGFDLSKLKDKGLIIGCNEAYKEYQGFDIMVSIDGQATALLAKNFAGLRVLKSGDSWYLNSKAFCAGPLPKLPPGFGYDSGRLAIHAALTMLPGTSIYLIGFDFGGPRIYTDKVSKRPPKYEDCWNHFFGKANFTYVGPQNEFTDRLNCKKLDYKDL